MAALTEEQELLKEQAKSWAAEVKCSTTMPSLPADCSIWSIDWESTSPAAASSSSTFVRSSEASISFFSRAASA